MRAKYGTFLERDYQDLEDSKEGFWWQDRMQELVFAKYPRDTKGSHAILPWANTLFFSPVDENGETIPKEKTMTEATPQPLPWRSIEGVNRTPCGRHENR